MTSTTRADRAGDGLTPPIHDTRSPKEVGV